MILTMQNQLEQQDQLLQDQHNHIVQLQQQVQAQEHQLQMQARNMEWANHQSLLAQQNAASNLEVEHLQEVIEELKTAVKEHKTAAEAAENSASTMAADHRLAVQQLQETIDWLKKSKDKKVSGAAASGKWEPEPPHQVGLKWCDLCKRKLYTGHGLCLNGKCITRMDLDECAVQVKAKDGSIWEWDGEKWGPAWNNWHKDWYAEDKAHNILLQQSAVNILWCLKCKTTRMNF